MLTTAGDTRFSIGASEGTVCHRRGGSVAIAGRPRRGPGGSQREGGEAIVKLRRAKPPEAGGMREGSEGFQGRGAHRVIVPA